MKLFMVKIGATPKGRLIEQHDVFFGVAKQLSDIVPMVDQFWYEVAGDWHVDAWREVTKVDDFAIEICPKNQQTSHPYRLFFINLGGYLPNQFEEFHYKTLVVAESMSQAIAKVKQSTFYQTYGFDNLNPYVSGQATSHVDNRHELIFDEIYDVADLLTYEMGLNIRPLNESQTADDPLHIGYLSLRQLQKFDEGFS